MCTNLQPTEAEDTTYAPGATACCSSGGDHELMDKPTRGSVNDSFGQTEPPKLPGKIIPSEKVVFGGYGREPGKFLRNSGAVVSPDNEIFVNDVHNKRIQVFSMSGVFLRLFRTAMVGANGREYDIQPCDVAMDAEGYLWVLGQRVYRTSALFVIKYSREGVALTMFDLQRWGWYPNIAVDTGNDIIVVEASAEIFMFRPDGELLRSFQLKQETEVRRFGREQGTDVESVAIDKEGNILVTDPSLTSPWVHVYNQSGHWLFKFGGFGQGEGELKHPQGVCVDAIGRILVVDWGNRRVDMFTSRGEFVRTVVKITHPWGIAVGPAGQLVVTSVQDSTVTVFPRQMLFP
ncbi:tripartite motif-containing protein 3-like [Branchiostoma lanceolatum]|uniref:tripartite motif-containing protein 3-like n=1 Tax=Branchiostoma lanceolatum TaxID=7740 RepID=UPI003452802F